MNYRIIAEAFRCGTMQHIGLDIEGKRKKSGRIPGQIPGSLVDPCVKGKLDLHSLTDLLFG